MLENLAQSSGYDTQERKLSNIRKEMRSLKTRSVNSSTRHMVSLVSQRKEVISLSYRGVKLTHFMWLSSFLWETVLLVKDLDPVFFENQCNQLIEKAHLMVQ